MLRILHVTNAYPYSEVPEYGVFIKEQIDSLNRTGAVRNDVVFMNGRRGGKMAYWNGLREIRRRAKECDIIHCHHLYSGFIAAAALTGKPRIISFLNDWLYEMDGVRSETIRRLGCNFGAWWADRLIFKSPIPSRFQGDNCVLYLPNGASSQQFRIVDRVETRTTLGLDPESVYLLFVSSKDLNRPQKRYDRFREVVATVRAAHPTRNIKELLLVNQPRDQVPNFFNAADLHLMTSDYEGSPNSVKEALCCGVPVVTTKVGNVAHLLDGSPHCRISTGFEVEELAGLVGEVLGEQVDREGIRQTFLDKGFSQERTARKLVDIYEELAARR